MGLHAQVGWVAYFARAWQAMPSSLLNHAFLLRDVLALQQTESKPSGVDTSSRAAQAAALNSYKREEEILTQQAATVAGQIRTLEAQLQSLRAQQAEIEEKRAALNSRQRAVWEGSSGAKGGRTAQVGSATRAMRGEGVFNF